MNEFTSTISTSRSTVNRFYKKYKSLKKERKKESRYMLIPESHIKYFRMDLMIEHELKLKKQVEQMKNLLECIRQGDDMQNFLWEMEWDLFATVSYKNIMRALTCVETMNRFYQQIKEIAGESEVRLFFTTEAYMDRKGHHNHFVCYCSDKTLIPAIQEHIEHTFSRDQVDLQTYDENDTAIFYITKNGIQGADWDLLL